MTTTNINLRIDDQIKTEASAYATAYGITFTAALNVLIRKGLQAEAVTSGPVPLVDRIQSVADVIDQRLSDETRDRQLIAEWASDRLHKLADELSR